MNDPKGLTEKAIEIVTRLAESHEVIDCSVESEIVSVDRDQGFILKEETKTVDLRVKFKAKPT